MLLSYAFRKATKTKRRLIKLHWRWRRSLVEKFYIQRNFTYRGITLNKILVRFEFLTIASACCHSALNHSWCRIFWYTGNKKMTPAEDFITLQLTGSISHSHSRFESLKIRHFSCNNFGSLQADSVVVCVCVFLFVLCIFLWFYLVTVANQSCGKR